MLALRGHRWPDRCVTCGVPTREVDRIELRIVYFPSWVWFLLLLGVLPYVIGRVVTMQRHRVVVPMCPSHARRRALVGLATPVLLVATFFAGLALSASLDHAGFTVISLAALAGFLVLPREVVRIREAVGPRIALVGPSEALRQTLPVWPADRGPFFDDLGDVR